MKTIGVFDSGIGGLSVAHAIEAALPQYPVIFKNDTAHVPYGTKKPAQILHYVVPILEDMVRQGCDVIVLACNTVSTTIIDELRARFKVPLIAMEPMLKPAAEQSKSGIIAVCATPTTLASKRYAWLKNHFAKGLKVLEPNCSDWSYLIEQNSLNFHRINDRIEEVCQRGADVIVLGCTHYHWIEEQIKKIVAGRAKVLQPEKPVIEQLKKVLGRSG